MAGVDLWRFYLGHGSMARAVVSCHRIVMTKREIGKNIKLKNTRISRFLGLLGGRFSMFPWRRARSSACILAFSRSVASHRTSLVAHKDNNNVLANQQAPKMPHYYFDWYYDDLPEKVVKVR